MSGSGNSENNLRVKLDYLRYESINHFETNLMKPIHQSCQEDFKTKLDELYQNLLTTKSR
jgi:hypothetical protein